MATGSTAAMSFHDFAHALHRCGVMSFAEDAGKGAKAGEGKDSESLHSQGSARVRTVFDEANRGNWPGDGKVKKDQRWSRHANALRFHGFLDLRRFGIILESAVDF